MQMPISKNIIIALGNQNHEMIHFVIHMTVIIYITNIHEYLHEVVNFISLSVILIENLTKSPSSFLGIGFISGLSVSLLTINTSIFVPSSYQGNFLRFEWFQTLAWISFFSSYEFFGMNFAKANLKPLFFKRSPKPME